KRHGPGVRPMGRAAGYRHRQGVEGMTAARLSQVFLTADELIVAANRRAMYDFPTVLAVRSRPATVDLRAGAHGRAERDLMSRGLLVDGGVNQELAAMLAALHRPDRELAMRLVTPDGTARISVARRGEHAVLARRVGDDIALRFVGAEVSHAA